jgi:hypothetical protein
MSPAIEVTLHGCTYRWNGHGWYNIQTYTVPPAAVTEELDRESLETRQRIEEDRVRVECIQALNQLRSRVEVYNAALNGGLPIAIRTAALAVYDAVDELWERSKGRSLPPPLVESLNHEQSRSGLKFIRQQDGHASICWACHARGLTTRVDKRVDPECHSCRWAVCFKCGACRDPKHGGCSAYNGENRA